MGCGPRVLGTRAILGSRRHAAEFIPAVADVCREHSVSPTAIGLVFVSTGPGSFTGLRISTAAARMIALATDARVVAVPTLEVIAQNATDTAAPPDRLVVMLDAKRGNVYAAAFAHREGHYVSLGEPVEADPARFLADHGGSASAVMGTGVAVHRETVESCRCPILSESLNQPRPETVYRLGFSRAVAGAFTDRRALVPTYVRPPEAEEKWRQRNESSA